jgi:hypothetical protein
MYSKSRKMHTLLTVEHQGFILFYFIILFFAQAGGRSTNKRNAYFIVTHRDASGSCGKSPASHRDGLVSRPVQYSMWDVWWKKWH